MPSAAPAHTALPASLLQRQSVVHLDELSDDVPFLFTQPIVSLPAHEFPSCDLFILSQSAPSLQKILNGLRLSKALLNWQVEQLSDEYFRMVNVDSDDINLILKAFGICLPMKLFTRGDLRSLKSSITVF